MIFDDVLTGLFKKSGVSLVHTPGAAMPPADPYDRSPNGEAAGDLDHPFTRPLRFDHVIVSWQAWLDAWKAEVAGDPPRRPLSGVPGVLPCEGVNRESFASRGLDRGSVSH